MRMPKTWIFTANSHKARILKFSGVERGLSPVKIFVNKAEAIAPQDTTEGRVFESSQDGGQHAYEAGQSPQEKERHAFTQEIITFLEAEKSNSSFERLVISLTPKMLTPLKEGLNNDVLASIVYSGDRDWTEDSEERIARQLDGVIAA